MLSRQYNSFAVYVTGGGGGGGAEILRVGERGAEITFVTHWSRVTHIWVGNLIIIGLDNGLSPGRRQAIIWTNAGTLLIGPLGTNFSEILIGIQTFSFKKMHLKMSSVKWRLFGLGLNELKGEGEPRTTRADKINWLTERQAYSLYSISSRHTHVIVKGKWRIRSENDGRNTWEGGAGKTLDHFNCFWTVPSHAKCHLDNRWCNH